LVLIFLCGEWHPTLLWPNGWMDEDATWYGSRPRAGHIVLDGFPALRERGTAPPSFRPMSVVTTVAHLSYCWALVKIFALLKSVWNLLRNQYDNTHLTLGMLLQYLGKLKFKFSADILQIWKKMQTNCICAPILIYLHVQLCMLSAFMC